MTWLNRLLRAASALASLIEVLLWAVVIGLAGLVIFRYRDWFRTFAGRETGKAKPPARPPNSSLVCK